MEELERKLEEIKTFLKSRIDNYERFLETNVKGKDFKEIDTLTWDLLSAYSAEEELANAIFKIIEMKP